MLGMLSAALYCGTLSAQQHKVEMIPFGNMDQWIDRQIKESGIIGGDTKNVYAIGPTATIHENKAYKNMGGSPYGYPYGHKSHLPSVRGRQKYLSW